MLRLRQRERDFRDSAACGGFGERQRALPHPGQTHWITQQIQHSLSEDNAVQLRVLYDQSSVRLGISLGIGPLMIPRGIGIRNEDARQADDRRLGEV